MLSLLPTVVADMRRGWSRHVICYDASLAGFGLVSSKVDAHDVAATGRQRESFRFKSFEARRLRPRDAEWSDRTSGAVVVDRIEEVHVAALSSSQIEFEGAVAGFAEVGAKATWKAAAVSSVESEGGRGGKLISQCSVRVRVGSMR